MEGIWRPGEVERQGGESDAKREVDKDVEHDGWRVDGFEGFGCEGGTERGPGLSCIRVMNGSPDEGEETQRAQLAQFELDDRPLDLLWPDGPDDLAEYQWSEYRSAHLQHDVAIQLGEVVRRLGRKPCSELGHRREIQLGDEEWADERAEKVAQRHLDHGCRLVAPGLLGHDDVGADRGGQSARRDQSDKRRNVYVRAGTSRAGDAEERCRGDEERHGLDDEVQSQITSVFEELVEWQG